ncbi:MAG: hypothetical protein KFB93_08810 [Simkaniaceae bacterium]|nr:MAG: hypothetical protein KFB93_08810 [Simkaniaceae bacterium]
MVTLTLTFFNKKVNMGFGLTKEHLDFYHENHFIEFEDLLSSKEVDQIEMGIDSVIPKESHGKEWIKAGHDVWRHDEQVKKIILRKNLAETASSLSKKRPLRIAYDQVIEGPLSKEPHNLIEVSSIRKVVCGLALQLESASTIEHPLVPKKRGSGIFFYPFQELNFPENCHLLMIAYTEEIALYIHEKRDPNVHALKKLGYGYGDRLLSTTHPILYRS